MNETLFTRPRSLARSLDYKCTKPVELAGGIALGRWMFSFVRALKLLQSRAAALLCACLLVLFLFLSPQRFV